MNPGATTSPVTSMTRVAAVGDRRRDAHDGVALDRDIAAIPRARRAINDLPAAQDEVVGGRLSREQHRREQQSGEYVAHARTITQDSLTLVGVDGARDEWRLLDPTVCRDFPQLDVIGQPDRTLVANNFGS